MSAAAVIQKDSFWVTHEVFWGDTEAMEEKKGRKQAGTRTLKRIRTHQIQVVTLFKISGRESQVTPKSLLSMIRVQHKTSIFVTQVLQNLLVSNTMQSVFINLERGKKDIEDSGMSPLTELE